MERRGRVFAPPLVRKIMTDIMGRKIKIWFRAVVLDYPYWRVTYKDGGITRLLLLGKAASLATIFGGKVWIDYTVLDNQ